MNRLRAQSRWLRLGLALVLLLAALSPAFLRPERRLTLSVFPCAFHSISGLPCLFCGGTRAVCAILAGDPRAAVYLNVLAFPVLALVVGVICVFLIEAATGRLIGPWEKIFHKLNRLAPLLLVPALAWWAFHVYSALKTPKPELVDLRNPIATKARALVLGTESANTR